MTLLLQANLVPSALMGAKSLQITGPASMSGELLLGTSCYRNKKDRRRNKSIRGYPVVESVSQQMHRLSSETPLA